LPEIKTILKDNVTMMHKRWPGDVNSKWAETLLNVIAFIFVRKEDCQAVMGMGGSEKMGIKKTSRGWS
jgi:hypothetical protein